MPRNKSSKCPRAPLDRMRFQHLLHRAVEYGTILRIERAAADTSMTRPSATQQSLTMWRVEKTPGEPQESTGRERILA